ncbi:MAG: hypothetical protein IPG87_17200 [Saprospiraceae bacterium]|nr:hypothetical protein [Candidatus Vicinibacter affinis]
MFFAGFTSPLDILIFGTYVGGTNSDYLGDVGDARGSNHLYVYGSDIYVGTTTHSIGHTPVIVGGFPGGFDKTKQDGNDSHVIFQIGLTSIIVVDYGDADFGSTPYHTLDCENLRLGSIDSDSTATVNWEARGDNSTGIDDEKAVINPLRFQGDLKILVFLWTVFTTPQAEMLFLYTWVNLNGDKDFQSNEVKIDTIPNGFNGTRTVTFNNVTISGNDTTKYLRLRLTTNTLLDDVNTVIKDERAYIPATNGELKITVWSN